MLGIYITYDITKLVNISRSERKLSIATAIQKIEEIIRRLPAEKLEILLEMARDIENEELSPQDIADIEGGKEEIARGDWVSLDEFNRQKRI